MVSRAPSSAMASRAPSSAMVPRAPSSAMVSRAPSSAMVSRAPSSAMVSRAPSSAMASVVCSALEVPVLCSCPCLSWGASRAPTPPPRWNCYGVGHAFREGGVMSGFCCVCHVFPPHVSIFGLFPVLVSCHYELSMFQLCLSNYLWFTCVFIVLSVQFDFVWSTRYSPVFLSVSLALSCPDVIKDCYFEFMSSSACSCSSLVCAPWHHGCICIHYWIYCIFHLQHLTLWRQFLHRRLILQISREDFSRNPKTWRGTGLF